MQTEHRTPWSMDHGAALLALSTLVLCPFSTCAKEKSHAWKRWKAPRVLPAATFGIRLTVSTAKRTCLHGEPIFAKVIATNVSEETKHVTELEGEWENALGLQFHGQTPRGKIRHFYGTGADEIYSPMGPKISLEPGGRTVGEFEITRHSNIGRPGSYEFFVSLLCFRGEEEVRVKSNAVRFLIEEPTGNEKRQYGALAAATGGSYIRLRSCLDSALQFIVENHPASIYAPYAHFEIGERARRKNKLERAVAHYRIVATQGRFFPLADNALVRLGECYHRQGKLDMANQILDEVARQYPDTEQTKRVRALRKKVIKARGEEG